MQGEILSIRNEGALELYGAVGMRYLLHVLSGPSCYT